MTMPHERVRSIRWGHAFLSELLLDESLDGSIQDTARRLLLTYPRPEEILALIKSGAAGLPKEAVAALIDASALWSRLQFSRQGKPETRRNLLFVQRHFPQPSVSRALGMAAVCGLRGWLLPEDHDYER